MAIFNSKLLVYQRVFIMVFTTSCHKLPLSICHSIQLLGAVLPAQKLRAETALRHHRPARNSLPEKLGWHLERRDVAASHMAG